MTAKNSGAKRAVTTVTLMAFAAALSKGLGLIRSVLTANAYGTGMEANAFTAASRIPLSFFDLLFSASILACFIPVYNGFSEEKSKEADAFAAIFLNVILLLTGIMAVLGMLFSEQLISLIAPDLPTETSVLASELLRILFPMIPFTGAAYTLVGILQSKERFLLPSMISVISNAGVILYLLFLNGRFGENGIRGLAAAYLVSWIIQFLTLFFPLCRMRFPFRLRTDLHNPALHKALRMTPPVMIGSWLAPIGLLSGTYFSSGLSVPGAVTVFEYAVNTDTVLCGILTYGICNFLFPKLSRLSAADSAKSFSDTARTGILSALACVLPVTAAVLVLSPEGITLLYRHGAFTADDVRETALALRCLAVSMPAFCVTEVSSRILYARSAVRPPMTAALFGALGNLSVSFLLTRFCGGALRVGAVSLGMAFGQIVCVLVLIPALIRRVPGLFSKAFLWEFAKLLLLFCLSFAVMAGIRSFLPRTEAPLFSFFVCIAVFLPSALLYLLGLWILKIRFH